MAAFPATARAGALPALDEVWMPRTVVRLGAWPAGPARLKAYAILADAAHPVAADLAEAAQGIAAAAGPEIAVTDHRGIGFAILHRDPEADFLLVHWWIAGGTLAERLFASPPGEPGRFAALDRPFMACVWELALVDHERRAYSRTAMAEGGTAEAYLDDVFRPDFC
jgi:hypothetical protein